MISLSERVARKFLIGGSSSYGGFVVNDEGKVLLREPANHFDGYHWTFAKGRADHGESPEEAALREVREETGVEAEIVGELPGAFRGGTSDVRMFLMRPIKDHGDYHWETQDVRWVDLEEAQKLVSQNTNPIGLERDLNILDVGFKTHSQYKAQTQPATQGTRAKHNEWWAQYLRDKWEEGKKKVPNPDWKPGDTEAHKNIQMLWRMRKDRSFSKQIARDFESYKQERSQKKSATMMFGPPGDGNKKPPNSMVIPSSGKPHSHVAPKKDPKKYHQQTLNKEIGATKKSKFLDLLVEAAKKNPKLGEALKSEFKDNPDLKEAFQKELNRRSYKPKLRSSYGGIVFNSEGKVLMRLPDPKMEPGSTWTFAKGGRDKDEMPSEAALREVYEETGVKAKIVGGVQGKYRGAGGDAHYYIMEPVDEKAEPDKFGNETAQIGWFTPQEAHDLISAGTNSVKRNRDLAVLAQTLEHRSPDSHMEADQKNWEIFLDKFYEGGKKQVPRPSDYKTPGQQSGDSQSGGNQKKTLSVSTLLKHHPPFRKALREQFKRWLATKKAPKSHPTY